MRDEEEEGSEQLGNWKWSSWQVPLTVPHYKRLAYKRGKGERLAPFHCELTDFVRSWWGCLDSLRAALSAALPAQRLWSCASVEHSRLQPSLDDFADAGVAHEMTRDEPWCGSQGRTGALYPEEQGSGFLFWVESLKKDILCKRFRIHAAGRSENAFVFQSQWEFSFTLCQK